MGSPTPKHLCRTQKRFFSQKTFFDQLSAAVYRNRGNGYIQQYCRTPEVLYYGDKKYFVLLNSDGTDSDHGSFRSPRGAALKAATRGHTSIELREGTNRVTVSQDQSQWWTDHLGCMVSAKIKANVEVGYCSLVAAHSHARYRQHLRGRLSLSGGTKRLFSEPNLLCDHRNRVMVSQTTFFQRYDRVISDIDACGAYISAAPSYVAVSIPKSSLISGMRLSVSSGCISNPASLTKNLSNANSSNFSCSLKNVTGIHTEHAFNALPEFLNPICPSWLNSQSSLSGPLTGTIFLFIS